MNIGAFGGAPICEAARDAVHNLVTSTFCWIRVNDIPYHTVSGVDRASSLSTCFSTARAYLVKINVCVRAGRQTPTG